LCRLPSFICPPSFPYVGHPSHKAVEGARSLPPR
jgi:hypothetical protein